MPGMSLSVCICLNCLPSSSAALDCPPGDEDPTRGDPNPPYPDDDAMTRELLPALPCVCEVRSAPSQDTPALAQTYPLTKVVGDCWTACRTPPFKCSVRMMKVFVHNRSLRLALPSAK
ncbi:hypothetical protein MRB53_041306 [Persea americana]|nr:hypothetical protein MRB53_041306 [Persea americana]